MFDDLPWFIQVAASPWGSFGLLVSLCIVFHIVLIYWIKLTERQWKKVDYIWLGIFALSLISVSAQARIYLSQAHVKYQEGPVLVAYDLLRGHLKFGADIAYCRTFVRSAFSPTDIEEVQKEYDLVCEWNKAAFSGLPILDIHMPLELKSDLFASFPKVKEQVLTNYRQEGENLVTSFNEAVEKLLQIRAAMEHSSLEKALSILWPLLLGIGFALRITKVTGELRLKK